MTRSEARLSACKRCGKVFFGRPDRLYCCHRCCNATWEEKNVRVPSRNCIVCGAPIKRLYGDQKTCSKKCRGKWGRQVVGREVSNRRTLSWQHRHPLKTRTATYKLRNFLKLWREKATFHGWRCAYCRKPLTESSLSADHRIPISRGGSDLLSNLLPVCYPCNRQKGKRTEGEYRTWLRKHANSEGVIVE